MGMGTAEDESSDKFQPNLSKGNSGGFEKVGVKKDHATGEIVGWQEFYKQVQSGNPGAAHDSQVDEATLAQVNASYAKNTNPSYIVEPEQPKRAEKIFFIRNQLNDNVFPVTILKGQKNRVILDGLPQEINAYAFNYTD